SPAFTTRMLGPPSTAKAFIPLRGQSPMRQTNFLLTLAPRSTELVIADVGRGEPALHEEHPQGGVDHRRRPRRVGAHVLEPASHGGGGDRVNEAPGEAEPGVPA